MAARTSLALKLPRYFINCAKTRYSLYKTVKSNPCATKYSLISSICKTFSQRFLPVSGTWNLGDYKVTALSKGCYKFSVSNGDKNQRLSPRRGAEESNKNSNEDDDEEFDYEEGLMLMDMPKRMWPNPFKSIKNFIFTVLIRASHPDFNPHEFLNGSYQAMLGVSQLISVGNFEHLEGLVTDDAIEEIKENWTNLDHGERELVAVDERHIFLKFIYEIGMIFDDNDNKRFVEITTVFHGNPMFAELSAGQNPVEHIQHNRELIKEKQYVCNYRFIREFTKGVEDDWTINQLNHYLTSEVMKNSNPFSR